MTHLTAGPTSRVQRLSRRSRRFVAAASLLGLPAMFAWSTVWTGTTVPTIVWGPVSFLLIGVTLAGAFILYSYVRNRADMPGTGLDEREQMLRDQAWILSYQVLSVVVVLLIGAIVLAVLGFGRTVTIDAGAATAGALCLGVLLPLLPAAALAWLEPDLPQEA
ncbi:MAG: hypothetical protein ACHQ01_10685 [Candidatus Limnocylindrales bacterium]